MKVKEIAKLCHEANRHYCEFLGDSSQPIWEKAPEWQKESAITGVKSIVDNPRTTPSDSHMGWYMQKEKDGWVYGKVKDTEKKEHPCMVPFNELPHEQQVKDILFVSIVKACIG